MARVEQQPTADTPNNSTKANEAPTGSTPQGSERVTVLMRAVGSASRFPLQLGYRLCDSRRVSVLWRPPGATQFPSRQARGRQVAYRSQFEASHQRVLSQGQALRVKLGGWEWAGYCGDDPPKPKWMRWKTYNRILDRSYEYEQVADALFVSR